MIIIVYAHVDKETCYEAGRRAGLQGEALEMFKFAGTEHKITYDVNVLTGEARVIQIDGRMVEA